LKNLGDPSIGELDDEEREEIEDFGEVPAANPPDTPF
jgi:hypothetical protein